MYNSPNHPDFVRHMMVLHNMAQDRNVEYNLRYSSEKDSWSLRVETGHLLHYKVSRGSLGLALEAAIEHLAGVPICK